MKIEIKRSIFDKDKNYYTRPSLTVEGQTFYSEFPLSEEHAEKLNMALENIFVAFQYFHGKSP